MFCTNCGKEIKDGENFCSACGTKAGEIANTSSNKSSSLFADDLKNKVMSILGKAVGIKEAFDNTKENKLLLILSIILPIVSMMFLGNTMFNASYEVFGYKTTLYYTMFEGADFLKTIFYIGYIVSAGMVVLPVFFGGKWDKKNLIPGMIMSVAAFVMFFIAMYSAKNEAATGQYATLMDAVDLKIQISMNAWIYLALSAANFVAAYMALSKVNRQDKDAQDKNEGNVVKFSDEIKLPEKADIKEQPKVKVIPVVKKAEKNEPEERAEPAVVNEDAVADEPQENHGLKDSEWDIAKNTMANLLQYGNAESANQYMEQVVDRLNESQFAELLEMMKKAGRRIYT